MRRATRAASDDGDHVIFHCPGCRDNHGIPIGKWTWNEDLEFPTFNPSLLILGNQWPKDEYPKYYKSQHAKVAAGGETVCHSFIKNGKIQFLNDSTHALSGQTVDIPEWSL